MDFPNEILSHFDVKSTEELGEFPLFSIIKKAKKMENENNLNETAKIILNKIYNFKVPISLDKNLKPLEDPLHKNDLRLKQIESNIFNFCEKNHYSYTPFDIINALFKLSKINDHERQFLYSKLKQKQDFTKHLQLILSIKLDMGRPTKHKEGSYIQNCFPIGMPKSSNRDEIAQSVLNDYWISTHQYSGKKQLHMIVQTSAELEQAEDLMASADVQVSHNERAMELIIEYGIFAAMNSISFYNEMMLCFPETGDLLIQLAKRSPDTLQQFILDVLYKRGVNLGTIELLQRKEWIHEHEKSLPSTRAMYKTKGKVFQDFSAFTETSTPITFTVANLSYLKQLIDLYVLENHQDREYWQDIIETIIKELRLAKGSQSFEVTSNHALLLTASAVFCVIFDSVRNLDKRFEATQIPKEIGITDDDSRGPKRVFRSIIDLIDHKRGQFKQKFSDLAGLFPIIDIQNTMLLVQITLIVFSYLEYYYTRKDSENNEYKINVENGVLTIHKLNDLEINAVMNLTELKILESFSD